MTPRQPTTYLYYYDHPGVTRIIVDIQHEDDRGILVTRGTDIHTTHWSDTTHWFPWSSVQRIVVES